MFNITKLTPSLLSDSTVDDLQDPKTPHINLVQMNTRTIDCHENLNIFIFKQQLKSKKRTRF